MISIIYNDNEHSFNFISFMEIDFQIFISSISSHIGFIKYHLHKILYSHIYQIYNYYQLIVYRLSITLYINIHISFILLFPFNFFFTFYTYVPVVKKLCHYNTICKCRTYIHYYHNYISCFLDGSKNSHERPKEEHKTCYRR